MCIENPSDRIRVDSGLSILPKGEKGTINSRPC